MMIWLLEKLIFDESTISRIDGGENMKKSEPKMILNVQIDNKELEEKVKIAIDKYTEQLVLKNLDDTIAKIIEKRIEKLINAKSWKQIEKLIICLLKNL